MLEIGLPITFNNKQYTLLQSLGLGGQGSIWKVERSSDKAVFALKVVNIYELHAGHPIRHRTEIIDDLIIRAEEGINFLSSLTDAEAHCIVPCLESGIINDEGFALPAMLMPVYTHDLAELTSAYRAEKNQGFDLTQLLDWIAQIANALSYIHRSGTATTPRVHRDIKPGNLLLNEQGNIYLSDVGIVKAANHVGMTSNVYSYDFCAPEQRLAVSENPEGERCYLITPAVDLYSLGIVIHELVAGSTHAQGELNDERNKNRHDRTLHDPETSHKQIGLLGSIGGLTQSEKKYLHLQLQRLSGIEPNTDITCMNEETESLPQPAWITYHLTEFITQLLAPWPDERPNAATTLSQVRQIRQALTPELVKFELRPEQVHTQQNQLWTLHLKLQGKGLPRDLRWIKASINFQSAAPASYNFLLPGFQLDNPASYDVMLPVDQELSLKLTLPGTQILGTQILKMTAYVAGQAFSASTQREITPCADYLWENGQRTEALQLDLRNDWLNQWQQEATTLTQLYEFAHVLEVLQKDYPNNTNLSLRRERLEKLDSGNTKQWWKVGLLPSAVLLITIVFMIKLQTSLNESSAMPIEAITNVKKTSDTLSLTQITPEPDFSVSISQMENDLFTGTEEQQYDAWLLLSQLLEQSTGHEKINEIQALKLRYEQETETWLESNDQDQQQSAFIRLIILGNTGDSNAQAWLGYYYLSGRIVGKNIETAKYWYQKAANQDNQDAAQQLQKIYESRY